MRTLVSDIPKHIGKNVTVAGWIHKIRKLGGVSFVVIRDRSGLAQVVVEKEAREILFGISNESVVSFTGKVKREKRAPLGAEILAKKANIISAVKEEIPVEINKKEIRANLDTLLDNRPLTLRNPTQRAIFKIHSEVIRSFRDFLYKEEFTEINSSKIVKSGLETGGAEMFEVSWFNSKAFLSQSPQMYKQIMVGVYERVFEAAFAYRAEKHSTGRHLNEYLSLDLEMGFIESHEDVMCLEEKMIAYIINNLKKRCSREIESLGAKLPEVPKRFPRLKLAEAQKILEKEFQEKCLGAPDLDPKQEKKISEYANKKWNTEFIFITHYPSKKRPFYTYDNPENPKETLSFDLIFRGVEITTGGQRIHLYEDCVRKMKDHNMDPKKFKDYLSIFRYGMPPHGGLAIGVERVTMKLLNLKNIRESNLFPRDINRLRP